MTPGLMPPLTPDEAADAADELWRRLTDLVDTVDGDAWQAPTPCEGWDVADLVAHLSGVTAQFAGLPQPAADPTWAPAAGLSPLDTLMEQGVAARRGWSAAQRLEELQTARAAHVDGLRALPDMDGKADGPTGPTTQRGLFQVRMFDLWHHLGDLAVALGGQRDTDDRTVAARECHAYVAGLTPWLFGRRAGAPEGATVRLSLGGPLDLDASVAVQEGRARWTDSPATDVVSGPPAWFSLLISGRTSNATATADGRLSASGPEAERLLSARMFA